MARDGVSVAITQRVLGHRDPALTLRVYTHIEARDLRQALIKRSPART